MWNLNKTERKQKRQSKQTGDHQRQEMEGREVGEGSQKVQTFRYKTNKPCNVQRGHYNK